MDKWDWNPYLVGGGARPDAVSGLNQGFEASLERLFLEAPPEIRAQLQLTSGYRSPEIQAQLWDAALKKYGSADVARKWVAPPGRSQHNHGTAADLKYLDPAAQAWVHENAARYGLHFPLENEPWHIEPIGSRDGPAQNALAFAPQAQPQNALAEPKPQEWQYTANQLDPAMFRSRRMDMQPVDFSQFRVG